MGFPIRRLSDILYKNLDSNLQPDFYCFVLYNEEHTKFRNFILDKFNDLHNMSRGVVFFILDRPESWLKREDIPYYRQTMGDAYQPALNDKEVEIVCEHFGVHPKKLPAVIAFPNLDSNSCNIFSLKDIENENELMHFFATLFTDERRNDRLERRQQRIPKRGLAVLMERSKKVRRNFRNISTLISYFEDKDNATDVLKKMAREMEELRHEVREGFSKVLTKLEEIHQDLTPLKENAKNTLRQLESLPDNLLKEKDIEEYREKIDGNLLNYSNEIAENYVVDNYVSISNYEFLAEFEENSVSMIRSCLIVENILRDQDVAGFDYSLCSVGLWKALEIELNIILIDTIRYIMSIVESIPSEGYSQKRGRIPVFAGYSYFRKKKDKYFVDINKKNRTVLRNFMFGDLIRLAENFDKNELQTFMELVKEELDFALETKDYMGEFTEKLRTVVYEYRNRCSHTSVMNHNEYLELKELVYSEDGLFQRVADLKKCALALTERDLDLVGGD